MTEAWQAYASDAPQAGWQARAVNRSTKSARGCHRAGHPVAPILKLAALASLLVVGAALAECQNQSFSIQGEVRTADGSPLPNDVTVRLMQAGNVTVGTQFVGSSGKFIFSDLSQALYQITVTAKGFQTVTLEVDMHYLASRYPTVYLRPMGEKKTASVPGSSTSVTDLSASKKAKAEYEKGDRDFQSKNLDAARAHLEKAVAEYPCFSRAQTTLGVVLAMQHEFAPAESALKKALECDGGFLEAYIQLSILENLENKYQENIANLTLGLNRFPTEWRLYYQRGLAYHGLRDEANAQADLVKAQSIGHDLPPEVHVKLADVYLRRKMYDNAYAEMQAYLHADPAGEYANETKSLMKQLESAGVLSPSPATGSTSLPSR